MREQKNQFKYMLAKTDEILAKKLDKTQEMFEQIHLKSDDEE